jgi:hypothetical protein
MAGEGDARSSAELAVKHVSWSKSLRRSGALPSKNEPTNLLA